MSGEGAGSGDAIDEYTQGDTVIKSIDCSTDAVLREFFKNYANGLVPDHHARMLSNLLMSFTSPQLVFLQDPLQKEDNKGRLEKPPGGRRFSGFEEGHEERMKAKEARDKKKVLGDSSRRPTSGRKKKSNWSKDQDVASSIPACGSSGQAGLHLPYLVVGTYDFGRGNFEQFMCFYIGLVRDVARDGNCGFRALAELLGISQDYWPMIRDSLMTEVHLHPYRYELWLQRHYETVTDYMSSLNWGVVGVDAPVGKWMDMPVSGAVFATAFQCTLVFLDWDNACTCLPFTRQATTRHAPLPGSILILCRVKTEQHYVAVWQRFKEFPMSPILTAWRDYHDAIVAGMDVQYAKRISDFIRFRQGDNRPSPI